MLFSSTDKITHYTYSERHGKQHAHRASKARKRRENAGEKVFPFSHEQEEAAEQQRKQRLAHCGIHEYRSGHQKEDYRTEEGFALGKIQSKRLIEKPCGKAAEDGIQKLCGDKAVVNGKVCKAYQQGEQRKKDDEELIIARGRVPILRNIQIMVAVRIALHPGFLPCF